MIYKFIIILIFLQEASASTLFGKSARVDLQLISEAYKVSLQIAKHCPKKDCLVVGIGRSPTIIIDILDRTKLANSVILPLSNFRYNPHDGDKAGDATGMILTGRQRTNVITYIGERIEQHVLSNIKKVFFIDFSITGKSVFAASEYFKEYTKQKNMNIQTELGIIGDVERFISISKNKKSFKVNKESVKIFPIGDERPLYRALSLQVFDSYSKFQELEIKRSFEIKRNTNSKRADYLHILDNFLDRVSTLEQHDCLVAIERLFI